jgi:acyl carrier protein
MTRGEFLQLIDEVIEAEPGTVKGDERLEDLGGWDSLAVVSFIAVVNQHFGITLSPEKIRAARNVGDLLAFIENRLVA